MKIFLPHVKQLKYGKLFIVFSKLKFLDLIYQTYDFNNFSKTCRTYSTRKLKRFKQE